MDRLNISRAQWARVEFQPDLKNPQSPVRLGLVLETTESDGSSVVVIGRMPIIDNRPKEFENTSVLTMQIAANWVNAMGKETIDVSGDDLFAKLSDGWHWNLYIVKPANVRVTATDTDATALAKRLYESFVGEPFGSMPRRKSSAKPKQQTQRASPPTTRALLTEDVPPAWMLKEIMDSSHLGAARA